MSQTKIKNKHIPVLLDKVLETLAPKKGESYLDLTAGYGGHASEIMSITNSNSVLVDRDQNAIDELAKKFGHSSNVELVHNDFLQASRELVEQGQSFDLILADLGVSSPHLDNVSRGFSLIAEGPLDMRMDERQELSAEVVVNTYSIEDLIRIISEYGEEPKARRMAELIIQSRPLKTTTELANIAKKVWTGYSRTHPATRLFQAIRIEVNSELRQIEQALPLMVKLLKPGGRIAIISFHSLEDRIVKRFFKEMSGNRYDADLVELTPKPVGATKTELVNNPRSRSAKMRSVAAKTKIKEGQG